MGGWSGGVYTRFRNWVTDKANSINPQAALFDQEDDGFAGGLNNCITKDGLNKPSSAMDWNGQSLTGVLNFANTGTVSLVSGKLTMNLTGNLTMTAPASGATMTLNMLDGSAGALIFDSGAPTSGYRLQFQQNGAIKAQVGLGSNVITGAAIGDFGFAANSTLIRFSTDGGTTTHAQLSAGVLQIRDPGGTMQNVGYREAPYAIKAANYTLALVDSGGAVEMGGAATQVTIPANASVAFPVGTVIAIFNNLAGNLTIAITTDGMFLVNTALTGNRMLATQGQATIVKRTATSWWIMGTGLS